MDLGIPLLLIIIATIPIAGLIIGIRKRAYLQFGLMLLFLITSLGGCGYFWNNFDIPNQSTGSEHMLGLWVFIVAGILTISTSILMMIMKKAEQGGPAYPPQGVGSADP